jgi:hypothetical protein
MGQYKRKITPMDAGEARTASVVGISADQMLDDNLRFTEANFSRGVTFTLSNSGKNNFVLDS